MRRRRFLGVLGGAAALPFPVRAQTPKVPRIGYLSPRSAALVANDRAFLQGLRELGYVEGTNILIESRFADGQFERLPELAAELDQSNSRPSSS